MDVNYFWCQEIGHSFKERLWGSKFVRNLEKFWKDDETIFEFGFCVMWRIMYADLGGCPTQPHWITVNYTFNCKENIQLKIVNNSINVGLKAATGCQFWLCEIDSAWHGGKPIKIRAINNLSWFTMTLLLTVFFKCDIFHTLMLFPWYIDRILNFAQQMFYIP